MDRLGDVHAGLWLLHLSGWTSLPDGATIAGGTICAASPLRVIGRQALQGMSPMELTDAHKHTFYDNGFVKMPGIVPPELVHAALRAINASLGAQGMHTPTNGVPEGTIATFTALVGVFLSDVPHDFMGNFTVWPGTHRLYEAYFRQHGPQTLLDGMPPLELPAPEQVTARAGDAVFCHYQLAHGIAGNSSPHIRYAVFFRLCHVDHEAVHWHCMTDIWREWAGMRDLIAEGVDELS